MNPSAATLGSEAGPARSELASGRIVLLSSVPYPCPNGQESGGMERHRADDETQAEQESAR